MASKKIGMESLILLYSLLFLSAATLSVDGLTENHLQDYIIPLHYDIYLQLHDTYRNISTYGECNITIQVNKLVQHISFHADKLQIQQLNVRFLMSELPPKNMLFPLSSVYDRETNINTYFFAEALFGRYLLYLSFNNVEDTEGSIFRTSFINDKGNRMWLVATDLWPKGARRLFPCWDEPAFQSSFSIIIKHPKNCTVLSNVPIPEKKKTEKDDMLETHFRKSALIPAYQVSVILLPSTFLKFKFVDDIFIVCRDQVNFYSFVKFAEIILNNITKSIQSQWCGKNFKLIPHIVIPGFQHDAVPNLGLIFHRETAIIYDEEKDPFIREIDIARLMGRTVVYQCFQNNIGLSWSYIWLNQAISTLLAMDAIDEAFPIYGVKDLLIVQTQQESLHLDSLMKPLISEVHNPSDIDLTSFYFACHMKGPAILRMLQQMLNKNVFQKGINKYITYNAPFFGKTSIEVFWSIMQNVIKDESTFEVEYINIKETMETWITQKHYPVVKVTENNIVVITTNSTNEKTRWWIPYTSTSEVNPDFSLSEKSITYILMGTDNITYIEMENNWIIVNLQQIGYYRVNYDAKSLKKITNYLNSDEYIKIHVLNRAQIMDDAFHFLISGELDLSVFVRHTTHLLLERDYIAWYPVIKAFEYMSSFFPYQESSYIKSKMIRILDKLHEEMGSDEISDPRNMNNSLKQEVARWACAFGSFQCWKQAYDRLKVNLKKNSHPLPWWKDWTYCNGLRIINNPILNDTSDIWDRVFNISIEIHDYTLLKSLACSDDFSTIRNYVELTKSERYAKNINDNNRVHIFHSIVARHAKNDTMLDYILTNLEKVKPREINIFVALIDIINYVYSEDSLNKIRKFLESLITWPSGLYKHLLIEDRLYDEINKECTIYVADLIILGKISFVDDKIKLRSSEIMRHVDQFRIFYSSEDFY